MVKTIDAVRHLHARDLDSALLAALLAVIDTGSFTGAAATLGVSQPAVSLAIKRLEERLGMALLVRTRKRVTPSRQGELLAVGARQAFEALGQAIAEIAEAHAEPSGRVILGCHESLAAYALPVFMARFLREYPKVELKLWNGRSAEVERELTDGRVDLALVVNARKHPDRIIQPLFDDSVELFHCMAARRFADAPTMLAAMPLIYVPELTQSQEILVELQRRHIATRRLLPCSSLELVKSLVLDEVGVGILPRRVAQHGTRKRLRSLSPPLPLYGDHVALVRRYDARPTAAIRAVIDELTARPCDDGRSAVSRNPPRSRSGRVPRSGHGDRNPKEVTMAIPTGRFVWFEYVGKDPKKAQGFFGELFNWKTSNMPTPDGGSYTMITLNNQEIGGYRPPADGAPPQAHWVSHLQVEDAVSTAAKIKSLGGKIRKEPQKMGDMGTMAMVVDPTGAAYALWQPVKSEGSGDYKDMPGAWCWNELMTDDPGKAVTFYKQVGGFEEEKMEAPGMGTYHMLKRDGKGRAGIVKKVTPDSPTAWVPYVQVSNVDQTAEKAKKLGGTIKVPPTDIPNIGRFAIFTDSQGAVMGILQPKR